MLWYVLVICLVILLLLIIYTLLIHHNRYYFWNLRHIIKDRNGVRKPGQAAEQIFGSQLPQAKQNCGETLACLQKDSTTDFSELISLEVDQEHSEFTIKFADVTLAHGGVRIHTHKRFYSSRAMDLTPENKNKYQPLKLKSYVVEKGSDHLGIYDEHMISWYSQDTKVLLLTTIRIYRDPRCVTFRIEFAEGLFEVSTDKYRIPCLEFPVFQNLSNRSLVFTYDQVNFSEPRAQFVPTSGPVLFYNEDLETFILSPTMNFLAAWNRPDKQSTISMGIEGSIKELPKQFWHEVILYADKGIARTFEKWGEILLKYYQKNRQPINIDTVLKYLGYWTDNGTYYYYNCAPYKNYEECLLAIRYQAQKQGIPYQYFQLDSWFYPKNDGTIVWNADPKYFPSSLQAFQDKLQLPLVCHNRWFSRNTMYMTRYKDGFIIERHSPNIFQKWDHSMKEGKKLRSWALPIKPEFWGELMQTAENWGCVCYEQDWLQPQWSFFDYLKENVYTGRIWLKNMAQAAAQRNISMQFCMTYPSFYLETLELPNVTHARCSDDYNCLKSKRLYIPHFTQTSMLSWAIGVWPWYDPFFSTCDPKAGSVNFLHRQPQHYEQWPELQLILQVLSGGPVGNGDRVDKLNSELLLQSCREDGILIKPDRPLFPIDLMFLPHHKPYICMTYSIVNDYRWYYLLQVLIWEDFKMEYYVTLPDLGLDGDYAVYDYFEKKVTPINNSTHIGKDHRMAKNDSSYLVLAPILENGMAFFGLRDKIATASQSIFKRIEVKDQTLFIEGEYQSRQEFAVIAYTPNKPNRVVLNGIDTSNFTWGINFKTFTIAIISDEGKFTLEIE